MTVAKRPSSHFETRAPIDPPACAPQIPVVVSGDMLRGAMLRLEQAVSWGAWDLCDRILADLRRQTADAAEEDLRPLEDRPVACLQELAGLPRKLADGLRCVNGYKRKPVLVGELLQYGRARLGTHEMYQDGKARIVWAAIGAAKRSIERRLAELTCWRVIC